MLRNFFNHYFGFNKQQRNGVMVLLIISFLLLAVRLAYPLFIKPDPIVLLDLPLLERKLDSAYSQTEYKPQRHSKKEFPSLQLFVFDPNTVTQEQLVQLGLKPKTIETFLKFRSKGFVFKQKEDLHKVYGISERLYSQLEPYIVINRAEEMPAKEIPKGESAPEKTASKKESAKVELNSVDSLTLIGLDGIGPHYAKRILKYRSILGGFIAIEQLKEVYGFSEELFQKIRGQVTADARNIRKMDLNKDDFKVINRHPYLSYEITRSIFDWRRKTTITAENLKEILQDEVLYRKILPYLSFS